MPRETKTKEKKPVVPKTAAKARSVDGGEATIYNQKGEKSGTYLLPAEIFGLPWNADLVHQIMHSQQLNARANTAHTKDRGDVRGGGKKPWQQKGTGRARHGSRRSPIWVGGGVAHGPTVERNYGRKINKKMREKALFTVLSQKVRDNEILFLSGLKLESPKTKLAREVLAGVSRVPRYGGMLKKENAAYILASEKENKDLRRAFGNMGNVKVSMVRDLNVVDALQYKYICFADIEAIEGRFKTVKK